MAYKGEKAARKVSDVIRAVCGKERYKRTSAVIVAAGDSSRMQGQNKQFLSVCGVPVLARSIMAFQASECIDEIVVVTKKDAIESVIEMCEKYGCDKVVAVVVGGANRQESVWLGFSEISDKSEFVAIHDGARCLITPEYIEKVCREAYVYGAATAAHRVTDTVKRTGKNTYSEETLDRDKIWLANTPQVFSSNLYRAAAYTARENNFFGTDDCSLVEHIGYSTVKLVECGKDNVKITVPEDILYAEMLLELRRKKEELS